MSELRHPHPELPTYAEANRGDYESARIRKERMDRGEDPWGSKAPPEHSCDVANLAGRIFAECSCGWSGDERDTREQASENCEAHRLASRPTPPEQKYMTLADGTVVTPEMERTLAAEEWARRREETIGELLDYIDWLEHHAR